MSCAARFLSCVAAFAICLNSAALAAGQSAETRENETREYGLALLQAESVAPAKGSTGRVKYVMKYRIVAVVEQPPGGKAVEAGASIERRLVPGTGRFLPPSLPQDFVTLERIYWRDGGLDSNPRARLPIPVKDPAKDAGRVAEYESKAFRNDVLKLRSARTASAEAVAFARLAASTPAPSASLVFEAERLRERRGLSYDARLSLCRGMLTLAVRADAPQYVRESALRRMGSAWLFGDRQKWRQWQVQEAGALLDAFHDWVHDAKRDVVYPEILLGALRSRLDQSWIRSAPALTHDIARLPKDLTAYEQRLQEAGDRVRLNRIKEMRPRLLKSLSDDAEPKK